MSRRSIHKKLKLIPFTQEGGAAAKKNFRGSPFIRNTPEYDIILKLGRIKGYDDNRHILGSDGKYVQGSDITMLLCEAMTPKRVLNGMDDFIKLLAKAKVDPDLIVNDNIRSRLTAYKRQNNTDDGDNIHIPSEEIVRTNTTTAQAIRNRQPSVALQRINLDDYRHLLGRGRSTKPTKTTSRPTQR